MIHGGRLFCKAARLNGTEKFDHFPWDAPIGSTELGPMVDSSDILDYDYVLINITDSKALVSIAMIIKSNGHN
ncbi:20218_t:CDS:2, partial [Gigaspora rosea]